MSRNGLALAIVAVCLAVAPPATGEPRLEPGAPGVAVTVLHGTRTEEIPLSFIGTIEDFAGPGYDLHLVELEGEVGEEVGVAAGMSGSPVYVDGELIGALSYRLGFMPKRAVAGVTPIADILDAARAPAAGRPGSDARLSPIATPVVLGGVAPGARRWIEPHLAERGFVMVSGGGSAGAASGSTTAEPAPLKPGSPVGVQLMRGDMRIAATGTVTWVDGDTVYAFGHPFLGTGRVELPMVSAEVVHTLADAAGSVKLANVGGEVGAIVEDRWTAVVGRRGRTAPMIPMSLAVRGGDYGDSRYEFELVKHSDLAPLLVGAAAANALLINNGYTQDTTIHARGRVLMRDLPELKIEQTFSGGASGDPAVSLAGDLYGTLALIWTNPFAKVDVERVEMELDVRPGVVAYELENVRFDRRKLVPGRELELECVLRKYRGALEVETLTIRVPEVAAADSVILAVGSAAGVDAALGRPLSRRLESATDLAGIVEALNEERSAHRLTAVIYEPGGAVVSRGELYSGLPPTAERLLSRQNATRTAKPSPAVSPMARAVAELDGPLRGAKQFRLRLIRGRGPQED